MASTGSDDREWQGFYRLSAVLLVVTGIGELVMCLLGATLYSQGYPADPASYLQLVSRHRLLANTLWSLWIIGDFLALAPTVALYLVLRRDNRTLALLGALFAGFYAFYDVSVTELNSLTLVSLGRDYADATTDAAKAAYVAAAAYGYAALPLQTVLSFGIGAIGWLLSSLVMLKGSVFPRWVAALGIAANVIGIVGAAGPVNLDIFALGLCQFLAVPLTGIWFTAVGAKLYRYAGR